MPRRHRGLTAQRPHQPINVLVPGLVVQHHCLPVDQPPELIGQIGRCWQGGAADQDRDHADVAVQRPGQFQADIVIGFEQAGSALPGLPRSASPGR
jgi:hypothetical protein